jgi:hypothetical protein
VKEQRRRRRKGWRRRIRLIQFAITAAADAQAAAAAAANAEGFQGIKKREGKQMMANTQTTLISVQFCSIYFKIGI